MPLEGCDYCASCDSCQICDHCENTCDTCESFCETGGQTNSTGFQWMRCGSQGELIGPGYFDLTVWKNAIDTINEIWSTGSQSNASWNIIPKEDFTFLSAAEFNRVSAAARCSRQVQKDEILYGSYFDELQSAINNLQYENGQCDSCNDGCDDGCDKCMSCDVSCNGINIACNDYCCDCCDNDCCDNDTEES